MDNTITVTFQFKPGDLVYFRGAAHHRGQRPARFCIETRMAEQCHGGIQRMYRLVGGDRYVPELALTSTEPGWQSKSDSDIEAEALEHKNEIDALSKDFAS